MINIKVFAILLPMKIFTKTCVPSAKIYPPRSAAIRYFSVFSFIFYFMLYVSTCFFRFCLEELKYDDDWIIGLVVFSGYEL